MLNASNRNTGTQLAFPDVCLTPAAPSPVPVPYPNQAETSQAVSFAVTVKVEGANAITMMSNVPTTSGDEAGSSHPVTKQAARYTMGNPKVRIEQMPAIVIGALSNGNSMNAPLGAVVAPSAVTVYFTDRTTEAHDVDLASLRHLQTCATARTIQPYPIEDGIALIRIERFAEDAGYALAAALAPLDESVVIVDLRGCPGGALEGAIRSIELFLSEGTPIAGIVDASGVRTSRSALGAMRFTQPLVVLVDRTTASAAELFAGVLQREHRAIVVGETTYGKNTIESVDPRGHYDTVAAWEINDCQPFHGLTPDLETEDPMASAVVIVRHLASRY
jgi:carboxyl-terminal processing protease